MTYRFKRDRRNDHWSTSLLERVLVVFLGRQDIEKMVEGKRQLYLRRFFIFRNPFFRVYLHKIVRSDEDRDPHDHPWDFTTIPLRGKYIDERWIPVPDDGWLSSSIQVSRLPYSIVPEEVKTFKAYRRKAEHTHRVQLIEGKPVWTLVVIGKPRRKWGFHTEGGWVPWQQYLNASADSQNMGGGDG